MYPYLIRFGGLSLPAYPVLYGLGLSLVGLVVIGLGRRAGMDSRKLAHLFLVLALSILFGGRLLYVILYADSFHGRWDEALNVAAEGQVHYGGLICALAMGIWANRFLRLPAGRTMDILAVGIPLGVAMGRLGCFCRGCCFGERTSLPWAVQYPPFVDAAGNVVGSPAFVHHVETAGLLKTAACSLPVHPVQLYSAAAAAFVILPLMTWFYRTQRFRGRLLFVYFGLTASERFFMEFVRVEKKVIGWLSLYQLLSLLILAGVALVVAMEAWRNRKPGEALPRQGA